MNSDEQSIGSSTLLTPEQFRQALGGAVGRNSIYELLKEGRIRSLSIGRKLLIPQSELTDWIQRELENHESLN